MERNDGLSGNSQESLSGCTEPRDGASVSNRESLTRCAPSAIRSARHHVAMAKFYVRDTFEIPDRRLFVIAGSVVEGEVRPAAYRALRSSEVERGGRWAIAGQPIAEAKGRWQRRRALRPSKRTGNAVLFKA